MSLHRRASLALVASAVSLPLILSSVTTGAEAYSTRSAKYRWKTTTSSSTSTTTSSTTSSSSTTTSSMTSSTTSSTTSTTRSTTTPTTTTTLLPTLTRVAADWPFAADSPWNIGVGTGATFESATGTKTADLITTSVTAWVNAGQYSHPIYKASDSDPMASVSRSGYPTEYYRIPNGATAARGTDMHMHVVEPNGRYVHECWKMQGANPTWTTGYHVRSDLWGPGMGQRGVRAYGGSAVGGLIRK